MKYLTTALILLSLGCDAPVDRTHSVVWLMDEERARSSGDNFDWQNLGPLDLIEHLKELMNRTKFPLYTVWSYHRDWIKASDLPDLRAVLDSQEPCAALGSPMSSFISTEGSTVGAVARTLIEGYESGGFPTWNEDAIKFLVDSIPVDSEVSEGTVLAAESN